MYQIDILSLGQGQEKAANAFISMAKEKGRWVVLQNCHLAPKYLSVIDFPWNNRVHNLNLGE